MEIIELFKQLTAIPRCSKTHLPFINFIKDFSKKYNYECDVDSFNNVLCYKQNTTPNIALQSHYDIVCLEENTIPEVIIEKDIIKAKSSTLGADNGIGCVYMMKLMTENKNCEFLFTSDEEIGLIGANDVEFDLKSKYMLNLDSESQGEICIGCAGGVDIFATTTKSQYIQNDTKELYEIIISDLDGGHSGVDIDKNIPNALKLISETIYNCNADLLDFNGGERINSIPKYAKAIIATQETPIATHNNMSIKKIELKSEHYKQLDKNIIEFLYNFSNGVLKYNEELKVVQTSANLAIVKNNVDNFQISISCRSMSNEELEELKNNILNQLHSYNFSTKTKGKYPAWKPQINQFTKTVEEIYKKFDENVEFKAVHAGLECAIFSDKFPNIQVCSIGPNIYFPHSTKEFCEISSANKVYDIVKTIVEQYQ